VRKRESLWAGLTLLGVGLLLILAAWFGQEHLFGAPTSTTPEPIIPTRTPTGETVLSPPPATQTPSRGTSMEALATPTPAANYASRHTHYQGQPRWGVGLAAEPISRYNVEPLRLGWYLDWTARPDPPRPHNVEYAQMARLRGGILRPDAETIASIAEATPGSLWLIGNEPDVKWQDNVEPAVYAQLYHEAYFAIKGADATAQVAIGGVTQPTPLRLRYLNLVLAAYQEQFSAEMPVDVWNVHNFILREERGSWGVDIPPGLPDEHGRLYEIDHGDDLEIFRQQIVDFRQWMAEHGYQNKPLVVSEYGILMPEEYGFPPERVVAFLTGTFDFFLTASDPALGYPADDYRLVQRWCWYSLDATENSYPTGRLFDPQTGAMTAVGKGWEMYVR